MTGFRANCAMPFEPASAETQLVIASDALAVRAALHHLFTGHTLKLLAASDRGAAEILLAEVLNNVVEHAYANLDGRIEMTIRVEDGSLICMIVDHGESMPACMLCGDLPSLSPDDLPEGGFGWHLIRTLASDLEYRRNDNRNELSFRLISGQ